MKTNNINNEEISAFIDGEIDIHRQDALLQQLRLPESRCDWALYHVIGDVVRSDEMAGECSAEFMHNFSARLALEPTYLPASSDDMPQVAGALSILPSKVVPIRQRFVRRSRFISGIAAGAAVLYVGGAYLANTKGLDSWHDTATTNIALSSPSQTLAPMQAASIHTEGAEQVVVMRDPRIDAYLMAHQRFSPAMYSTAPFARSATFTNDSTK